MTLTEKRKSKYPDTSYFHYHNANPKNKITTDCVIRALCTAMDKPYNEVVMDLAKLQCETGYDTCDDKLYDKYLQQNGWVKCKQPKQDFGRKYTGKEFCFALSHPIYIEDLKLSDKEFDIHKVIANIGSHHVVAIMDFQIWDIWDSSDGSIGKVWVKEI